MREVLSTAIVSINDSLIINKVGSNNERHFSLSTFYKIHSNAHTPPTTVHFLYVAKVIFFIVGRQIHVLIVIEIFHSFVDRLNIYRQAINRDLHCNDINVCIL